MSTCPNVRRPFFAGVAFPLANAFVEIKFSVLANVDLLLELSGHYHAEFEQTIFSLGVPGFSIPDVSVCHLFFLLRIVSK